MPYAMFAYLGSCISVRKRASEVVLSFFRLKKKKKQSFHVIRTSWPFIFVPLLCLMHSLSENSVLYPKLNTAYPWERPARKWGNCTNCNFRTIKSYARRIPRRGTSFFGPKQKGGGPTRIYIHPRYPSFRGASCRFHSPSLSTAIGRLVVAHRRKVQVRPPGLSALGHLSSRRHRGYSLNCRTVRPWTRRALCDLHAMYRAICRLPATAVSIINTCSTTVIHRSLPYPPRSVRGLFGACQSIPRVNAGIIAFSLIRKSDLCQLIDVSSSFLFFVRKSLAFTVNTIVAMYVSGGRNSR